MKYFYAVHVQANANEELDFFIPVAESNLENDNKVPPLTADMIKGNASYIEFTTKKSFKTVLVDYVVYVAETEFESMEKSDFNDFFSSLITQGKTMRITGGEIEINHSKKGKKKKNKLSKTFYAIIGGGILLSLIIGVGIGKNFGEKPILSDEVVEDFEKMDISSDGMVMPELIQLSDGAAYLVISIDRSYSPVPKEDINLKGELIKGKAKITLPYFDPNDYFNHVPGYTWGFTSDPKGVKIEYYSGKTYDFEENIKLYRVLVKYGGGSGTKDDPYLIDYYDQLELMAEEKARGYFQQNADIVFPEWARNISIDTVNQLKQTPELEHFEYDGGGFKIYGLTAPLFGTVSGSAIKNVNIINSTFSTLESKHYGFLVCEAYNYRYVVDGVSYETGETLITNSSVSHSKIKIEYPEIETETGKHVSKTLPPVVPPGVETEALGEEEEEETEVVVRKTGEFALGTITGIGGQIESCYVNNVELLVNTNDYYLNVGGISGKPANVINSGVSNLSIKGNIFNAGGIAGSGNGSRLHSADGSNLPIFYGGNFLGCFVRGFTAVVENSVGGIVGEGGTNAENSLIANCYATALNLTAGVFDEKQGSKIILPGITGGVIGADGNEDFGHLVTNTVSIADYSVIGNTVNSQYDETVRIAPSFAFYQSTILAVINKNTVLNNEPKSIFTGSFIYAADDRNSDENGKLPYPDKISKVIEKTLPEETEGS